ncbi:hypothetical protein OCF84_21600 (plasmid) [Shewanella xiamenensis]|uniref:Uncharacterized protein n=1 Tax=Shewanella xiamenensis TaxID=332186 RepID=A0ABT6UGA5_9GAMM|nr:hypothetical protein [Shewanella xiamenensis]MDI5832526.1 hypothetical protein [Shewanella xiamenensis]WHF57855.1 hypothetical protein OCF84_21600 [Shewanella xiamenensis]
MPCIVDPAHPFSKQSGNCWKSLCGKSIFMTNNPFMTVESAQSSDKPICKACRKIANIPPKNVSVSKFEPYVLYMAFMGELSVLNVVGETNTNYRLDSGSLKLKYERTRDLYWLRSDAGHAFYSRNKEEAVKMAKTQLQQRIQYLQSKIDDANKSLKLLG